MPKPVIAAVNGVAAGAGASLAFACDLRILADTAGFNLAFAGVALSCDTGVELDAASGWSGRAKALELLYFPRTVDAAEALDLGLATQVVPGRRRSPATVGALAGRAGRRPDRRATARSASRWRTPPGTASQESLAFESAMMTLTGATADHRGRRRRVRGQGEAGLRGPLTPADSDRGTSGRAAQLAAPATEDRARTWRGAVTRIRVRPGCGAVLDGERGAGEAVVVPLGHGAVADAAAVEGLRGRSQRPGHAGGRTRGFLVSVSTPCSGWWKLSMRRGLTSLQEPHHRPGLGLGAGRGPDS